MAASKVFLLPSLNEGLPTVALEAQASGLPCLLSDNITKECRITHAIHFYPPISLITNNLSNSFWMR